MSSSTPRKTGALSNRQFNVLVGGGGITGAWIALDCALRGYSVALIEKNDFGAQRLPVLPSSYTAEFGISNNWS